MYDVCQLEKLEDCIEASTCQNHPFTKWESDFIDSVNEQHSEHDQLSERQWEIIERIWDKI